MAIGFGTHGELRLCHAELGKFSKRGNNPGNLDRFPGNADPFSRSVRFGGILAGATTVMGGAMFRRPALFGPMEPWDLTVRPTGGDPTPGGRAAVIVLTSC